MRFRNIDNWTDPEKLTGLLFFAQRLEELTFDYTLDSYRAPTTNAPYLVRECLNALEAHRETGTPISSALHILDETEARLRENPVVRRLLNVRLENYLNYDRKNIADLERKLRVLGKEISPRVYALTCFELAKEYSSSNEKIKLDFLARETVTTLQNLGVSTFHIGTTVRKFFFGDKEIKDTSDMDEFFREIFPHSHFFKVCLKISTDIYEIRKEILDLFGLLFSKTVPKAFLSEGTKSRSMYLKPGERYIIVKDVKAPDRHSAVKKAKEKIARVHDLYGLFHHKSCYYLSDEGLAQQKCCSEETYLIKASINRMHFIEDNKPKEAATKLDNMIRNLNLPRGNDREKFFRVIDFHGMSAQSDVVENQLLNLWTSLETLVPNRGAKTIISGVVYGALPFVGLRYFRRLFRTLTFDIVRWNRYILGSTLKSVEAPAGCDLVEKVFCLVVAKENEDLLADFLGKLMNFELLRFRIFRMNQAFKSASKTMRALDEHQKRVEWQIHRIYRTRNSIVHSGQTPAFTEYLVANAHDYFDQIFSLSCEFCSGSKGFDNYSDCFDYAEWLFDQYKSDLGKIGEFSATDYSKVLWRSRTTPKKSRLFPNTKGNK